VGTYGAQPMGKELTLEAVRIRVERQPRFCEIIHIFLTTCYKQCGESQLFVLSNMESADSLLYSGDSIRNR
jgi:hypothetical protein